MSCTTSLVDAAEVFIEAQRLPQALYRGLARLRRIQYKRLDLAGLCRIRKVLDQHAFALDSAVGDFANLFRVEALPRLSVEVFVERKDENWIYEVDECIAHVAVVLEVDRQVEEVVALGVLPVDLLEEHLLGIFVRDVFDHDSGAAVFAAQDGVQVKDESVGASGGCLGPRNDLVGLLELAHAELHLRGGEGHHLRLVEGRARQAEEFLSGAGLGQLLALPETSLEGCGVGTLAEHELVVREVHLLMDERLRSLAAERAYRFL